MAELLAPRRHPGRRARRCCQRGRAPVRVAEFAPFLWSFQDAERLTFAENEFDFCIVHSGLHHCYSPHRALLEMYRVARVGLLVFEPRDGALVRLGMRLNVVRNTRWPPFAAMT
jgi:SAM-dependent methyltransferase